MKTKKILSVLLSLLIAFTSFPVTALADDDEYLYNVDGIIIAEDDIFTDFPDKDISASYEGTQWTYSSQYKWLFIDSVNDNGSVDSIEDKRVPTMIKYFEIYDIEKVKAEFPDDYNDYINAGYTDEEIYESLDETTDEDGNVYRGLFKDAYVDLTAYVRHVRFGPKARYIREMKLSDIKNLESVEFEEGNLEQIGKLFSGCNISEITLPSSLKDIAANEFYGCGAQKIDISKTNIEVLPTQSFASTGNQRTLKLNDKIRQVDDYAFCESGIKSIDFPNTLNWIGGYAFSKADIESLDLSKTDIRSIEAYTFFYSKLKSIKLNNKISLIGMHAFTNTEIESIIVPSSVKKIDTSAFSGTSKLKEITLVNTESIGGYAFQGSGIKRADLCLTKIDKVQECTFAQTNIDEVLLPENNNYRIDAKAFYGAKIGTLSMPMVKVISANAFQKAYVKNLVIPSSASFTTQSFANADFEYVRCEKTLFNSFPFDSKQLKTFVYTCHDDGDTTYSQYIRQCDSFASKEVVVYGYTDTKLYEYCVENGIEFHSLDKEMVYPRSADEAANGTQTNVEELENSKHGTWSNGTWELHENNMLHFYGSGDMLSATITDNNGTEYTIADYITANGITKLNLHDGITALPDNFLYDEETGVTLNTVYLPYDLHSIGDNAFRKTNIGTFISQAFIYIDNLYPGYNIFPNAKVALLPEHIEHIGKYAFAETTGFDNYMFMMPNDLTEISEGLFYGSNVKCVFFIKNNVTSVGKKAFANCPNLQELEISYKITDIYEDEEQPENNSFGINEDGTVNAALTVKVGETKTQSTVEQYCEKYGINISHEVDPTEQGTISTSASGNYFDWKYYESTNTVYFKINTSKGESKVEQAPGYYFAYDNALMSGSREEEPAICKRINYFDGLEALPIGGHSPYLQSEDISNTFFEVDKVVVESGVERICASNVFAAFNPKTIQLPDTLKYLDYNVFGNCTRLEAINIPDSVTDIGSKVFYNCPALKYVNLGNGISTVPTKLFYNVKSLRFVDIGTEVKTIENQAFYNCTALEEIVIPANVTTINDEAFYNCIKAQQITIGKGVTWIGENAFSNSVYCESIVINTDKIVSKDLGRAFKDVGIYTNGVTVSYGESVFTLDFTFIQNLKIDKVIVGKNTDNIKNIRYAPNTITEISVSDGNPNFSINNKCLYQGTYLKMAPRTLKNISIADGTTVIGVNAFENSKINSIAIPNSVTRIADYAFNNCSELKSLKMGKNVEVIGEYAFAECNQLRLAYFPDKVINIGNYSFKNCSSLSNITFVFDTNNLSVIGTGAFYGCSSLKSVVFPQNLREIKDNAFIKCTGLESVYLWNTQIPDKCFSKNEGLEIYTISGSSAHAYARTNSIVFHAYTDDDIFLEECATKIDELAGYLGYCENGHGNIEYLTVYEADCTHEGYEIGVCEYCSEILKERHTPALGHNYQEIVTVPSTDMTRGFKEEKCLNCGESFCTYFEPTGNNITIETHTVTGRVTAAQSRLGTASDSSVENVNIIIDGKVVATTNYNGVFRLTLETGTYQATLKYAYGFSRDIYIIVEDEDISISQPISIIACDFNKDGKIDNEDMKLFSMVISSSEDDVSYLRFVDINNDGYINGKDQAYIRNTIGVNQKDFAYETMIVTK
ncbi:MAG: hypothetical protein E7571_07135 [Ruminococcaceae bacterium]|nr:hypothetical protein [Oscillospiraceae bacterium]